MIYDIAEKLYKDWQTSDRELRTPWNQAPLTLRRVFLHKAVIAARVAARGWKL